MTASSNITSFAVQSFSLSGLSSASIDAMKNGGLTRAFQIPNSQMVIGEWKVFAFLQNETGAYPNSYAGGSILAGAVIAFNVSTPSPSMDGTNFLVLFVTLFAGVGTIVYSIFSQRR